MGASVLVGYATRYGSTEEVAETVAATLRECGFEVDLRALAEVRSLAGYVAVVMGAPLLMYRWHKDARRFLSRHRRELVERPVAVFALGPVHDPHDEKEWEGSRSQLDKELAEYAWLEPIALAIFGGKFDPAKLGFLVGRMAGAEPATDIRDWTAIRAWARELAAKLEPSREA